MAYVAAAQAVVILALVAVLLLRERDHDSTDSAREARFATERNALMNRISHPEIIQPAPFPPTDGPAPASQKPKDWHEMAKIGTVAAQVSNG